MYSYFQATRNIFHKISTVKKLERKTTVVDYFRVEFLVMGNKNKKIKIETKKKKKILDSQTQLTPSTF